MKKVLMFDTPVSAEYIEQGYGVVLEQDGIYGIYCNIDDGSTGDVGLVSTGDELALFTNGNAVSESFDGYGYEMELENGDCMVYYKVEL